MKRRLVPAYTVDALAQVFNDDDGAFDDVGIGLLQSLLGDGTLGGCFWTFGAVTEDFEYLFFETVCEVEFGTSSSNAEG